jgi:outer membrane protein assembly factor BamB
MMRNRLFNQLAATAAILLWAGAARAAFDAGLIDVSFGSSDAAYSGKAVVGSQGDQWNTPEGQEGTAVALTDVKGAKTDVRLTFDADRTYDAKEQSPFAGGSYENLMRHYLVATQPRKVALAGLTPKAGYYLYLYNASDGGGDGRTTTFTVGERSKSATFTKDKSEFAADVNYVRLPVVADADGKVTISYGSERGEGNLNAMQIVPAKAAGAVAGDTPSKTTVRPKGPSVAKTGPAKTSRSDRTDVAANNPSSRKTPKARSSAAKRPITGAAGEWPYWLGPNRDGKSLDTGLLKQWPDDGPALLWQADGIGVGFASVAVAGGKIYITGDKDGKLLLTTFDMDGQQLWQVPCGKSRGGPDGSRSSPVIDHGNIYILDGNGLLGCYDQATGKKKWAKESREWHGGPGGWGYAESPLVLGKLVIFKPGGKTCIVALDKTTGETVWESSGFEAGPEYGSCIPVTFEGQEMIVTGTGRGIFAVDAQSGKLLWSNDFSAGNTANCPTPAYADGYVFWANGYGQGGICLKLKKEDDKIVADVAWKTHDMVCHHGGYVIHEGYIYGNHEGGWTCLELASGQKKWHERAVGKGSLCFADNMLFLFSENSGQAGLATCSPDGLQLKGKVKVKGDGPSWAHPVVVGGRLYLRYDTHLYCFDVKNPG